MDKFQTRLVVAAVLSTLSIAAAFPLISGCGGGDDSPPKIVTRKAPGGTITQRTYSDGMVTYQREGGPELNSGSLPSAGFEPMRTEFFAAADRVEGASKAAAVEREKLTPSTPAHPPTPPGSVTPPLTGPKVDLPTQIYQPPSTPSVYQPPSSPSTYHPPGGGTYHPH